MCSASLTFVVVVKPTCCVQKVWSCDVGVRRCGLLAILVCIIDACGMWCGVFVEVRCWFLPKHGSAGTLQMCWGWHSTLTDSQSLQARMMWVSDVVVCWQSFWWVWCLLLTLACIAASSRQTNCTWCSFLEYTRWARSWLRQCLHAWSLTFAFVFFVEFCVTLFCLRLHFRMESTLIGTIGWHSWQLLWCWW